MRIHRLPDVSERSSPIFLSPHFDDAVYSCGGLLARLVQEGLHPLVVTVCGGVPHPEEPVSEITGWFHNAMGLGHESGAHTLIAMRRREDQQVCGLLGSDHMWLGYYDAIYRGSPPFYPTFQRLLSGDIHPDDHRLSEQLLHELLGLHQRFPGLTWYAPLGIGRHVDHQLVSAAAISLQQQGAHVRFYEDFPYVLREGQLAARLQELELPLTPMLVDISDVLPLRIEGAYGYPSQIAVNFGKAECILRDIVAYTGQIAQAPSTYAERYWTL